MKNPCKIKVETTLFHVIRLLSDVNFDPPRKDMAREISIHLYMLFKFYIEKKDSDYPQNRWITIANYGNSRNTVLRRKPKKCGEKISGWVLPLV